MEADSTDVSLPYVSFHRELRKSFRKKRSFDLTINFSSITGRSRLETSKIAFRHETIKEKDFSRDNDSSR